MPKLIESIPFAPQKWDDELKEIIPKIRIDVYEGINGKLSLHFMINDECMQFIGNVCPHHFRDQITFFWMGLEQGYDIASEEALS